MAKYKGVTLNAIEMLTIAEEMRKQNKEPNELMPYSEFGSASATYAVINAIESIGKGLAAEERRKTEAWMESMRAQQEWQDEHSDEIKAMRARVRPSAH